METKSARLKSAFGELIRRGIVSAQKDIAAKMNASPANVSSALNGNETYITDKFLTRFNAAFDNIFSIDWLITGKGDMLRGEVTQVSLGDMSPNVNGDGNHVNSSADVSRVIDELTAQRTMFERFIEKRDSQIDRLISVIENFKIKK